MEEVQTIFNNDTLEELIEDVIIEIVEVVENENETE